ncbi:uncharacterized protein LOC122513568 isoform X2 [Polistes fuscatus]|nr:uncharacterized protein LOC122513568 isoform X2 [Polistes fuscatus]
MDAVCISHLFIRYRNWRKAREKQQLDSSHYFGGSSLSLSPSSSSLFFSLFLFRLKQGEKRIIGEDEQGTVNSLERWQECRYSLSLVDGYISRVDSLEVRKSTGNQSQAFLRDGGGEGLDECSPGYRFPMLPVEEAQRPIPEKAQNYDARVLACTRGCFGLDETRE